MDLLKTISKLLSKPLVLFIILISLLMSVVNSSQYFSGILNTPPDKVYLGTSHFPMDYFLYLNHFFQGAHGAWLTVNRYTGEPTSPSIIYWSNLLMGKLGGALGLTPDISYNLWVIILTFLVLISAALVLKKIFPGQPRLILFGFIYSTFATSLMNHIYVNGQGMWFPFLLWRTPHFAFDRLGNVPHQLLQTILFLWLTLIYFRNNKPGPAIMLMVLSVALTTLNPAQTAIFICVAALVEILGFIQGGKVNLSKLILLAFPNLLTFIYTGQILHTLPHLQSLIWELAQQDKTDILFLLLSMGPISILAISGLPFVDRKKPIFQFTAILPLLCYGLFLSPLLIY